MTPNGTILIEDRPLVTRILDLERESYSGNWNVVKAIDSFALDRRSTPPAGTSFSWLRK